MKNAKGFLLAFKHSLYTLQYHRNGKPVGFKCVKREDLEQASSTGELTYLLLGEHSLTDTEVFFTPNEHDGIIKPGKKYPRSKQNTTKITSLYIDIDHCPLRLVDAFLVKVKLRPHFLVSTSPGKYHVYFLFDPIDVSKKVIRQFEYMQNVLATLGIPGQETGCDPNMTDYSRLLRVPDTYHLKSTPHLITVKHLDSPKLSWDLLTSIFKPFEDAYNHDASTDKKPVYSLPTYVPESSRHNDMCSLIGSLVAKDVHPALIESLFYAHAKVHYEDYNLFLPKGARNKEVTSFIEYAVANRATEKAKEITDIYPDLPQSNEPKNVLSLDLPDDFYYNCPGIIGDIVKEITDTAFIKSPAIAFATACAFVGTLKASHTTSSLGHAPCNYFLCLAPTGSGKNYSQEVIAATLHKLKLTKLTDSKLRSDRGLLNFLQRNKSTGLIMSDEVKDFLAAINSETGKTASYQKNIKSLLLELYTSTNVASRSFGLVADKKEQEITLQRPRLNYVGFGTLSTLNTAFNHATIEDGLFQRFLVITDTRDLERNANFAPSQALNSNIYVYLEKITSHLRPIADADMLAKLALEQAELEEELAKSLSKTEELAVLDRVRNLEEERAAILVPPEVPERIIPFEPGAEDLLWSYADTLISLSNRHKHHPAQGLFTRGAEQVGRLATTIADTTITREIVKYCIDFVDSRVQSIFSYVDQGGLSQRSSETSETATAILKAISKHYQDHGVAMPYRLLRDKVSSARRALVKEVIEDLIEQRLIAKVQLSSGGATYLPTKQSHL
jgi:hypothetical protein